MSSRRVMRQFRTIVTVAVLMITTATAYAQTPSSSTGSIPMVSAERQEHIIEVLRPCIEWMNGESDNKFIGPVVAVFFFLMILTYAKRSK